MSFWTNPWKATKSFVNKYIPGGRYITGADTARQKQLYNESRDRYGNYASEAQATINNLSQQLQQAQQVLRSLEEQQYQASSRSYDNATPTRLSYSTI